MFTLDQIKEIARKLQLFGIKDSQFKSTNTIIGDENIPIIKNGENRTLTISDFVEYLKGVIPDNPFPEYEYCVLIIKPIPKDAIVYLNNKARNSISVRKGEAVDIIIIASGYKTYRDTIVVNSTKDVIIPLQKEEPITKYGTLKVQAIPENSIIKINNTTTNEIRTKLYSYVNVEVSCEGYNTYTDKIQVTQENQILSVTLTPISESSVTFSISPTPKSATVKINNEIRNSIIIVKGTRVTWSVEALGYNSQKGEEIVNNNTVKEVTLTPIESGKVSFFVDAIPSTFNNKIQLSNKDGILENPAIVNLGTSVNIVIPVEEDPLIFLYYPFQKTVTVTESKKETVTMIQASKYEEQQIIGIENTPFEGGIVEGEFSCKISWNNGTTTIKSTILGEWSCIGDGIEYLNNNRFKWSENTSQEPRSAVVKFKKNIGNGIILEATKTIVQNGKGQEVLEVSPTYLTFEDIGGSKQIQITSTTSWVIN